MGLLCGKVCNKTVPLLLKPKKGVANRKIASIATYSDEWITESESLRNDMNKICLSTSMTDQDFIIHIKSITEEYNVILGGTESRLMLSESHPNKLTIEDIQDNLNNRVGQINGRKVDKNYNKEDMALRAFMRNYKGTCNTYGNYSHKRVAYIGLNSNGNENRKEK